LPHHLTNEVHVHGGSSAIAEPKVECQATLEYPTVRPDLDETGKEPLEDHEFPKSRKAQAGQSRTGE
jgi:hypothetical protein